VAADAGQVRGEERGEHAENLVAINPHDESSLNRHWYNRAAILRGEIMGAGTVLNLLLFAAAAEPAGFERSSPELAKVADFHGVVEVLCRSQAFRLADKLAHNESDKEFSLTKNEMGRLAVIVKEAADATRAKTLNPSESDDFQEQTLLTLLPKAFTPVQVRRFREAYCQGVGLMALRLDTFARELGLTVEQQAAITKLVDQAHDRALNLHRGIFVLRSEAETPRFGRPLVALSWKLDSDILQLLSAKQRRAWIDLLGTPIDRPETVLQAAVSPDGSKIAFAGTRTSYGNYLGIVGRDGMNRRVLVDDGELVGHPRFSPDGQRLLFTTSAGGRWGLCVMDLNGKNLRRLEVDNLNPTQGGCYSPDGAQVAFGTHRTGSAVVDLRTGVARRLTDLGFRPVFSPDGRTVAVQAEEDIYQKIVPASLRLVNVDGKSSTELLIIGYNPEFSQDGRIVFLSGKDDHQDVWSMKPDGSDQRQLTKSGGSKRSLSMATRTDLIIFLHQMAKGQRWQLCEMRLDGTDVKKLSLFH
jgi:hypothetical protein